MTLVQQVYNLDPLQDWGLCFRFSHPKIRLQVSKPLVENQQMYKDPEESFNCCHR